MSECPNCGKAIPSWRIVDHEDGGTPYAECPDCWEIHPVSSPLS